MKSAAETFMANNVSKIIFKTEQNIKKIDNVCALVKKCLKCERIITGKYVSNHKCGYKECTNCCQYVDKDHKCYIKEINI